MPTNIAINGFGRIGRCILRQILLDKRSDLRVVGINDLESAEVMAHLLEFDSVHHTFSMPVRAEGNALSVGDQKIPIFAEKNPAALPWRKQEAEIVLECTGRFRSRAQASMHIEAGAKRVIISAPGEKDIDATFCFGINHKEFDPAKHMVVSNASCTTNCLAPIAKVVHDSFGIVAAHMVTVHSYTNDQRILDLAHKDFRRARAAALSMIPSTTGAAKAIGLVLPELKGKLDGTSIRVPTPDGSITCLTAKVSKKTSRDEVNQALKAASETTLKDILGYETRPLVSCDFIGDTRSSIVDAAQTQVVGDDLVEVQSWYDNEWGFSARMVDLTQYMGQKG
ncbi:MAG: type I glyceraldehyde-3-phosphate dehydrogenase [Myxococcales bacterium]|nr:type I glyceraldehyde-3-phosphate dehydrogenase [Myxococcales bacterium]MCB9708562.1 type I glyceraldehyde-3-phosphate dehydrogenase [Myxococcales bacterium]